MRGNFVYAPIAQLDRASDYGSEGWGFKSSWAYFLLGEKLVSPTPEKVLSVLDPLCIALRKFERIPSKDHFRFEIGTLDNPGWTIDLDLSGTELDGRSFTTINESRSEHNWIFCKVEKSKFSACGGPLNLREMLRLLVGWIDEAITFQEDRRIIRNDPISQLEMWYVRQTDGDWEHEYGADIRWNPAQWNVEIDISKLEIRDFQVDKPADPSYIHDWYSWKTGDDRFVATGGTESITAILRDFGNFAL